MERGKRQNIGFSVIQAATLRQNRVLKIKKNANTRSEKHGMHKHSCVSDRTGGAGLKHRIFGPYLGAPTSKAHGTMPTIQYSGWKGGT